LPRFVVHGMCLNEELYLETSLRSVYDFADSISLVEGATRFTHGANPYGLSTDRTAEVIRDFPDPEGKITFRQLGRVPTKRELRNASLWLLEWQPDTVVIVLDLDEVWDKKSLENIVETFVADPTVQYIHNELYQFRGDFEHYRDMNQGKGVQEQRIWAEQNKRAPITTRDGTVLHEGRTAERVFRWDQGDTYVSHVTISDRLGRYKYIDPAYEKTRVWCPDIYFSHTNYLSPFEDVIRRFLYYAERDGKMPRGSRDVVQRAVNESYIRHLRGKKDPDDEWIFTPLPENFRMPEELKEHHLFGKSEEEISDPEGQWLHLDEETLINKIMEEIVE
jgi:hypothetical protein